MYGHTHPLPLLHVFSIPSRFLLHSSDQHSVTDIWQELANTWMSSAQANHRQVVAGSPWHTRTQRMNHREMSVEDSAHGTTEVKQRKQSKSSKGGERWSCPDETLISPSTDAPTEEPHNASRLSRFSFFRKSFARSRKEGRNIKHSSCGDLLEVSSREEVHPAALHSVAVNGSHRSACWSEWAESSDGAQGQSRKRAVSHSGLLHRVAWECEPSTCSIATDVNMGEAHVRSQPPQVEGEGTVVQLRSRLKRMWDSLKTN